MAIFISGQNVRNTRKKGAFNFGIALTTNAKMNFNRTELRNEKEKLIFFSFFFQLEVRFDVCKFENDRDVWAAYCSRTHNRQITLSN